MSSRDNSPTPSEPPPWGFRIDVRRALYPVYAGEVDGGLQPVEDYPSPAAIPRIRLVTWIESLVAAGCQLQLNDLHPRLWEDLATLKSERNRFEREVIEQKTKNRAEQRAEDRARNDARKIDKIPAPGVSLFAKGKR